MGKYGPESMFASLSAAQTAAKRPKWKESEENNALEYKF